MLPSGSRGNFCFTLSRGEAVPPFRRLAAAGEIGPTGPGVIRHDMAYALPPSGGGDKRGQGHQMVPLPPLDSPKPSFALTHRRCAAKRGKRGLGSVRRFAFGTLSGPEFTLRKPPRITVRGQTVQGANAVAAKGSASIKRVPLEHQTSLWDPRILDARPKGVASKGRSGESRGDRKPCLVSCPLLPSAVGTASPPPKAAILTPSEGVISPPAARHCIGGTACRQRTVKRKKPLLRA